MYALRFLSSYTLFPFCLTRFFRCDSLLSNLNLYFIIFYRFSYPPNSEKGRAETVIDLFFIRTPRRKENSTTSIIHSQPDCRTVFRALNRKFKSDCLVAILYPPARCGMMKLWSKAMHLNRTTSNNITWRGVENKGGKNHTQKYIHSFDSSAVQKMMCKLGKIVI